MTRPLYLDYNATTPADARVVEAMLPFFSDHFGNASSAGHAWGWAAAKAVDEAREAVAALVEATPEEIIFTSGATEAANLAIKGVARRYAEKGRHLVTCRTEHRAVLDPHAHLEREGFEVTYLDVDSEGRVAPEALAAALRPDTTLVSLMRANNETGVVHATEAFYDLCRAQGVLLFVDATQAPGKVPLSSRHADLLALSAHKFYGPKGVGALYARRRGPRVSLVPLLDGGGQERGLRAGTLNTPGIVGMGAAARLVLEEGRDEANRLQTLRDELEAHLADALGAAIEVNGAGAPRLPNTSSLTVPGVPAARIMAEARTLGLSAGSACASATGRPSHVLLAMGRDPDAARATLRASFGRMSRPEDARLAAERLLAAIERVRAAGAAR